MQSGKALLNKNLAWIPHAPSILEDTTYQDTIDECDKFPHMEKEQRDEIIYRIETSYSYLDI